ncbi:LysM peptidoglycan-binding domain-containing protein [Kocuria sp.]|uniref:LysM peptidoglycan-binding domain-containing protein n=1 Tax=Kocuria sp. TaxID=1871328 RepID=UPI0026DEB34E|nr:LysM peptidoglycan-binding domain-containing protein [Kocuria sp.]MDO5618725.1 LysM peptidoglycan-binding domain-containing protein [Kocuria sp.]
MSAISLLPRITHRSAPSAPLLRGVRSGCRAFGAEVVAAVPALQRAGAQSAGVQKTLQKAEAKQKAQSKQSVHLTRRGRLLFVGLPVMLATAAVAMALLILVAPATVTASTEPVQGPGTEVVTVASGESLWEVARTADADRDTRVVIAEIMELNDLRSQSVAAGQQLLVPAK